MATKTTTTGKNTRRVAVQKDGTTTSAGKNTHRVGVRKVESIVDEVEMMHEEVMRRAYEIFARRATPGEPVEDWLTAEEELTWKPAIELVEQEGKLILEAAVAGMEPKDLDVQVTSEDVLIKSNRTHDDSDDLTVHRCEFVRGRLFRDVRLPSPIDPKRAKAEYRNGLLRVTAPVAGKSASRSA